jgi:hypothetical protein
MHTFLDFGKKSGPQTIKQLNLLIIEPVPEAASFISTRINSK